MNAERCAHYTQCFRHVILISVYSAVQYSTVPTNDECGSAPIFKHGDGALLEEVVAVVGGALAPSGELHVGERAVLEAVAGRQQRVGQHIAPSSARVSVRHKGLL